ncbi:hypothetical protein LTR10_023723 [Elasticomyces elasticus]|uniref:Integral membrane protein n=1 Tax=Exophiala sideris TaxID=1016849 RepID=A0ABR0J013_9EURO|nr:hypothetical protein LTR10_023723 [Elasticomyces elasticus]KAK5023577.1 hypothetical protein LTS07_009085 [Exophiala sideris]KAK5029577.1 hypothetical protein LTR13_008497 [Exophiala sideris]KAK5053366.1 hypothetical protein LTR69_009324 [Exophiala sideris]KAK5179124.1 hypothetical protein LTR44_008278 [Eurotiomycetes sp. CCFEE 6388]
MPSRHHVVAALLQRISFAAAYAPDGAHKAGTTGMDMSEHGAFGNNTTTHNSQQNMASYAGVSEHSTIILMHIVLMVLAWIFLLPIGVMFSIARSGLALPVQFCFCVIHALGLLFGTIYNVKTPDLYRNNAHHTIGWVASWIISVQVLTNLLSVVQKRREKSRNASGGVERQPFLPSSMANRSRQGMSSYANHHASTETEPGSSSIRSTRSSEDLEKPSPQDNYDSQSEASSSYRPSFPRSSSLLTSFPVRLRSKLPAWLSRALSVFDAIVTRTILPLGFVGLVSGGVVYTGIFRGKHIFNGLAHFIKGGIFFWYGLLTLGRWMGCFAEYGWAWNIAPTSTVPSAEFVESFVLFLYGSTNVFLEHLAAWGKAWTAQDLEHVSISVLFLGGGLCGMLVESKVIRNRLNTIIGSMPTNSSSNSNCHTGRAQIQDQYLEQQLRTPPEVYNFSINPIPALIIFLLGIMMSSHHQSSQTSTAVHKQWGTLLAGSSIMRMLTYTILYISPPTSVYPSRPPTELISSFCLIAGGTVFMASTKDIVHWMESENLMAMFVFTVTGGFTAFIMAYEIFVLSLKGWATQRELERSLKSRSSGS